MNVTISLIVFSEPSDRERGMSFEAFLAVVLQERPKSCRRIRDYHLSFQQPPYLPPGNLLCVNGPLDSSVIEFVERDAIGTPKFISEQHVARWLQALDAEVSVVAALPQDQIEAVVIANKRFKDGLASGFLLYPKRVPFIVLKIPLANQVGIDYRCFLIS